MNVSPIQLNPDQSQAYVELKKFLKDPTRFVFTLTGGPGTGKTFMLRDLLKDYFPSEIQAVTVSHAAKNILQESLGPAINCMTISKLLGMAPSILQEGEIKFVPKTDSKRNPSLIGKAKILIIDEVSQIDDETYKMITDQATHHKTKIIAVGDPYQLPPVEQNHDSMFFTNIDFTLTIPMRFTGPISEIAALYKSQIDCINSDEGLFDRWQLNNKTGRKDHFENNTGYGFINNLDHMIDLVVADLKSHPEDSSYTRVLAYKNESVAEVNHRVRAKLYGKHLKQFEKNEIVICNGGYSVTKLINPYNSFKSEYRVIPILYNGQILAIDSYEEHEGPEGIPCVLVKFVPSKNQIPFIDPIFVVSNTFEAQQKYNILKNKKLQEALKTSQGAMKIAAWKRYYKFIESFAYFDYAYSVNLYKSQGQTLSNVYVCEGEVMGVQPLTWKQKFQALYVAMTRAKEKLFIYNKEF